MLAQISALRRRRNTLYQQKNRYKGDQGRTTKIDEELNTVTDKLQELRARLRCSMVSNHRERAAEVSQTFVAAFQDATRAFAEMKDLHEEALGELVQGDF